MGLLAVTNDLHQGQMLSQNRADVLQIDINNKDQLDALLEAHDCAISLLPAPLHPIIAESCIRSGTNLVTASYESSAMHNLHEAAQKAGVVRRSGSFISSGD